MDDALLVNSETGLIEFSLPHVSCERFPQWLHMTRLKPKKRTLACFICRQMTGELKTCSFKHRVTEARCNTTFHQECLDTYNAGGLVPSMLKRKQPGFCPSHHCSNCSALHRRTTAFEGDIIQCYYCVRGFHKDCISACAAFKFGDMSAAPMIDKDGNPFKGQYVICPIHQKLTIPPIPASKHLNYCFKCTRDESGLGKMLKCGNCFRQVHEACYEFSAILPKENKCPFLCQVCVHADVLPAGTITLVHWRGKWYPAIAVYAGLFPLDTRDKFAIAYCEPGYITFRWLGFRESYICVPYQHTTELTIGALDEYFPCPDNRSHLAWAELESVFEQLPTPPVSLKPQTRLTNFKFSKKSVYKSEAAKETKIHHKQEHQCDCTGPNRCAENCSVAASNYECTKSCDAKGDGLCQNRFIARGESCKYVERRITPGKGEGLFATKDLAKGTFLGEYVGDIITKAEQSERDSVLSEESNDEMMRYSMQLDSRRYIDAAKRGNCTRFLNHSCDPNCRTGAIDAIISENSTTVTTDQRLVLYTCRSIAKGEELTFDYQMIDSNAVSFISFPCFCGSDKCRGTLGKRRPNVFARAKRDKMFQALYKFDPDAEQTSSKNGKRKCSTSTKFSTGKVRKIKQENAGSKATKSTPKKRRTTAIETKEFKVIKQESELDSELESQTVTRRSPLHDINA